MGALKAEERDAELAADLRLWKVPESEIDLITLREAVEPEPEIDPDNIPYRRAFMDLTSSRNMGFSVGSIPVSEIGAYWDRAGVDDFETFLRRIRAADNAFMKWLRESKGKST